jgi:hypothetical protein
MCVTSGYNIVVYNINTRITIWYYMWTTIYEKKKRKHFKDIIQHNFLGERTLILLHYNFEQCIRHNYLLKDFEITFILVTEIISISLTDVWS